MAELKKQVDDILEDWNQTTTPGCTIAIVHQGEVLYKRGYGMANLELSVPITPSSVFYLASVSKQFAATAIALLVEGGEIAMTDEIRQYLPELPDIYSGVTINHLVRHTSGIRDYLALGSLAGKKIEDVWTEGDFLEMLKHQKNLNFAPGDEYMYSNSGYVLLTMIVKLVSGQSMQAFSNEHIFQPLGMNQTIYKEDHQMVIPNRVSGYSRKEGSYVNEFHNLHLVGDGGLYSSVDDLIRWDQNFYHNRLGKGQQSLIDMLHTTTPLNNGTEQNYGFGLATETYRGLKVVTHGGSLNGARTIMSRFPEQNFTVICLSNLSDFNPADVVYKVVDVCLSEDLNPTDSQATMASAAFNTEELENLRDKVGFYHNPSTGQTRQIILQNDQLIVPVTNEFIVTLEPLDVNRFKAVGYPVEVVFKPMESGSAYQMIEIHGNNSPLIYEPVTNTKQTSDALNEYAGTYYSDELYTSYVIEADNEKLILRHSRKEDNELYPTIDDGFKGNRVDIYFTRDKNRSISGFSLYNYGVRNLHIAKI